jgi:cell division cycle 14
MDLASIVSFVQLLDLETVMFPSCRIVYCVESGRRALSNAVFLVGSYMILKHKMSVDEVRKTFDWVNSSLVEPFRDATFSEPDFGLTLEDCWRGLARSRNIGWVQYQAGEGTWGKINLADYTHFGDMSNGNLHAVVPGKLIAFQGPVAPPDGQSDDLLSRSSLNYYAQTFRALGVTDVVRLNEAEYDRAHFTASGIRHHDLPFRDCTAPPPRVVEEFFRIVDEAEGVVAVHCLAGLGRTGTLAGLHLMRSWGFTAREAMGWLRIMRPGSVIGEQQHYLCEVEGAASGGVGVFEASVRRAARLLTLGGAGGDSGCRRGDSEVLAGQVTAAVKRRGSLCSPEWQSAPSVLHIKCPRDSRRSSLPF